jgi:hypothetical protein
MRRWYVVVSLILVGAIAWALHPVCVPLSSEDLRAFTTPIDQRTDRDLYLRVFQLRDGKWHQCKMWISRRFFF